MSPEQEQLFDQALLVTLDRNHSQFGLGVQALQVLIGQFGFSAARDEAITRRLDYMADEKIGFVKEISRTANKAVRAWKITAAGIDELRSRGL